ncbi:MAG: hypothetical protein GX901_00525 [Lentisphaerae bacterium]|nr:hypothetical protein [Lentisphaerota bacterium]
MPGALVQTSVCALRKLELALFSIGFSRRKFVVQTSVCALSKLQLALFKLCMDEIAIVGKQFQLTEGEKKLTVVQEVQDRKVRCDVEKEISNTFALYSPVAYKTFIGALATFFEHECPQLGGSRTRGVLVR